MSMQRAADAYIAGVIIGIPAFLVVAKLFIWIVPAISHFLDAAL